MFTNKQKYKTYRGEPSADTRSPTCFFTVCVFRGTFLIIIAASTLCCVKRKHVRQQKVIEEALDARLLSKVDFLKILDVILKKKEGEKDQKHIRSAEWLPSTKLRHKKDSEPKHRVETRFFLALQGSKCTYFLGVHWFNSNFRSTVSWRLRQIVFIRTIWLFVLNFFFLNHLCAGDQ